MSRQLLFAITLIGTERLLPNSAATAVTALQCEDRAANCIGRRSDRTGGAGDWGGHQNNVLPNCVRQLDRLTIRAR